MEIQQNEKAKIFDDDNPEVWREYVRIARLAKLRGFKRWSSRAIFEVIRLESRVMNGVVLNNNHTKYYAQKLVKKYPSEFDGFFEFRNKKKV